jgi:hypothetical protein
MPPSPQLSKTTISSLVQPMQLMETTLPSLIPRM